MSDHQLDVYLVEGKISIHHDIFRCECDDPHGNRDRWLRTTKSARSEEEVAQEALDTWARERGITTKHCYSRYTDAYPTIFNLSLNEREKELLLAWNSGEPIRGNVHA